MATQILVSRIAGLIEAEVDGELVGLHLDNGTCYGFNRTATRVWGLLESPRTVAELCGALLAEFEVDRATCKAELMGLLEELRQDGLVQFAKAGATAG